MIRFQLAFLALLAILGFASIAMAFSTETTSGALKGPSSNFADPDEQQPAFVTGPGDGSQQQEQQQPSTGVDQNAWRENALGLSQGFDHAYNHQQQ